MNQRQWIPIEESATPNLSRMKKLEWMMTAVGTLLFLLIGIAVGQPLLGVLGLIVFGAFSWSIGRHAEEAVLASLSLTPANEQDHARLFNIVEGLRMSSGDHRPAMYITLSEFPLAMAISEEGSDGHIVVSDGFLRIMDRVETEAVVSHLLWRIRSGDAALMAYLISFHALMSRVGLSRLAQKVMERSLDARSLIWADISACQATRYPPALISALEKCAQSQKPVSVGIAAPFCFAMPETTGGSTHVGSNVSNVGFARPSLAERIAVLKEI
jgi:heat shock protein HtpX